MNIQSLRFDDQLGDGQERVTRDIENLLLTTGKLREVLVISAYTDTLSIERLLAILAESADSRTRPKFRVFIDKAASRISSDREARASLLRLQREIELSCATDSGIYLVQSGPLFHSKAYLIESNNSARIVLGSMNFTQKGVRDNEELILVEDVDLSVKSSRGKRLATWIKKYATALTKTKSARVVSGEIEGNYASSMRQLLLDGQIYYETKEQSPFRFRLLLPEEAARQRADIDPLLEANVSDSISIEALITAPKGIGLGLTLPAIKQNKSMWKKFCVETCFGYWNPTRRAADLEESLRNRSVAREVYFSEIERLMREKSSELCTSFIALCERIQKRLASLGLSGWKYADLGVAEQSWHEWSASMAEKMSNVHYRRKLIRGVMSVPSPDVWGDPLSAEDFEKSFCESVVYYWSKEYSKETSNVIARALTANLELDYGSIEVTDSTQLLTRIVQWLNDESNISRSIVDFQDDEE